MDDKELQSIVELALRVSDDERVHLAIDELGYKIADLKSENLRLSERLREYTEDRKCEGT